MCPKPHRLFTLLVMTSFLLVASAGAANHTVNINGLTFVPADLTISVGDTVTWVNDGGFHNVVGDDGTFTSGPPSTDMWQFSHTFSKGGEYGYHCEVHLGDGMTGTVTVEGIFADGLETGSLDAWDGVIPVIPNCDCYFSNDCEEPNGFCDWGNLTEEDICIWRNNKPTAPNTGCDVFHEGPWTAGICDGVCSPSSLGSLLGWEKLDVLKKGAVLWSEALLRPAEAGGGPLDPQLVQEAMALPFSTPSAATNLGRQVASLLADMGVPEFYDHFCHFEGHPDAPDENTEVDLSGDSCRSAAARLAIDALLAEFQQAGSGDAILDGVMDACPNWHALYEPRCAQGENALSCAKQRVREAAVFLATPRNDRLQRMFDNPQTGAK